MNISKKILFISSMFLMFIFSGNLLANDCYRGTLDKQYCDRNRDMVADLPLDSSKWVNPKTAHPPVGKTRTCPLRTLRLPRTRKTMKLAGNFWLWSIKYLPSCGNWVSWSDFCTFARKHTKFVCMQ